MFFSWLVCLCLKMRDLIWVFFSLFLSIFCSYVYFLLKTMYVLHPQSDQKHLVQVLKDVICSVPYAFQYTVVYVPRPIIQFGRTLAFRFHLEVFQVYYGEDCNNAQFYRFGLHFSRHLISSRAFANGMGKDTTPPHHN